MAGIYIHIPFCRQACHYCNFHFATSIRFKNELVAALLKEAALQREYLAGQLVETVYLGGGTPSLLPAEDVAALLSGIRNSYSLAEEAEITLEANPDDISPEKLESWKAIGVNRLSIGVQSFFDEDLLWMNRAHQSRQARQGLEWALEYFDNITIDLIYGLPQLSNERWQKNVQTALGYGVPHLSCYALTVEENTPLRKMIRQGKLAQVDPDRQSEQFLLLMDWLEQAGYDHYEISNFAKPGYRSRHNSSYWQGRHYLGLGPSAHSYNGSSRQWNKANNPIYIESIEKGIIPCEVEMLTPMQQMNEYIMTSLRTSSGVDLDQLGDKEGRELSTRSRIFMDRGYLKQEGNHLLLTKEGKLLADGIAADLFFD